MSPLAIKAALAERGIDLDLAVPDGTVVAVVGPNGAGKTSLLHLVAGLALPTSGSVRIADREVAGPTGSVPIHQRRVALLTQRPALFPHLDVLRNVAFGSRAGGASVVAATRRALAELEAVGCADLARRRPQDLSGGQAQRVAIARALATDPDVVLLDEPMAGLDVAVAAELRHTLAVRLRGRTALLVTHELLDIWTIADVVVVIDGGRVVETGPVATILSRPTSTFLGRLAGTNLFTGVALDETTLELVPGVNLYGLPDPDQPPVAGQAGLASVQPAAVALHLVDPGGSPRNHLACEITAVEPRGHYVRVTLVVAGQPFSADLTGQAVAELGLRPGLEVRAAVKATQVRLYGR
jgi:molybdate transport system ATP-binding protein